MAEEKLKILVAAGMIDRKFFSKIRPLMELNEVEQLYVVRKTPVEGKKITCFAPSGIFGRHIALIELYRLVTMIYIILRYRPRILLSSGLMLNGFYCNILGTVFRKKKILLLMGQYELPLHFPPENFFQRLRLKVATMADKIGVRGGNTRRLLIKHGFPPDKIFIPPNVFDFDQFPSQEAKNDYDLIYVCNLEEHKRVDLFIDCILELVDKYQLKDIKAAVIGEGNLKSDLQQKAQEDNIAGNIDFLPVGDADYVCSLLNRSRIFCITSRAEGLPMVIVEAFSCGLPVVSFNVGDISDIVREGENGFLFEFGEVEAMASKIYQILKDETLYNRLSINASRIREENEHVYSLDNLKRIWREVLQEVME